MQLAKHVSNEDKEGTIEAILYVNNKMASWPAEKLVTMAAMRNLGRGCWVTVSIATVVESYNEGPDGATVGGGSSS